MASHQMPLEGHVVVRLTVDPDAPTHHRDRQIRLTRTNNSMTIGRASKVEAKGFVAKTDNGWFDSPVMSRSHARIVADMDSKGVDIIDVDSLHGTFVNGEQLKKDSPRALMDGDKIRFGAAIYRATETYPPTLVRVGIEFQEPPMPELVQTFRAPEVIEIDDHDGVSTDDGSVQVGEDSEVTARLGSDTKLPAIVDLTSPLPDESAGNDDKGDSASSIRLSSNSEDEGMYDGESYDSSSEMSIGYGDDCEESDVDDEAYDMEDSMELETEDEYSAEDELFLSRGLFQWDEDSDAGFDVDRTTDGPLPSAAVEAANHQAVVEVIQNCPLSPKAYGFNIESLLNPADSTPSVSSPTASTNAALAAQTLGARHGKQEFFTAREANKVNVSGSSLASPTSPPEAAVAEGAVTVTADTPQPPSASLDSADVPAVKLSAVEHLASSALLEAGEKFLNSPIQEKEVDAQSSHDDEILVSAADFMQKKCAFTSNNQKSTTNLKRKSDRITDEVFDTVSLALHASNTAEAERPAKRQMTPAAKRASSIRSTAWAIMEKAAVAAVGGGIVFAGMIMTAPTLT